MDRTAATGARAAARPESAGSRAISPVTGVEQLVRELAPQALGALARRYGNFDLCEDAVQEALLAAATQWPEEGVPDNPRGWLITVASRRLTDLLRSESARRRREANAIASLPADELVARPADAPDAKDDTLTLLFMCCHPALSAHSQIALTLRAVAGLTTAEIASAFLVPEATMAQRISRAKRTIKTSGIAFQMPPDAERADRRNSVLQVLYLIFNEGYTATSGPDLHRADLTAEAIRVAGMVHEQLPDDGEVTGLYALMLLTDARRPARTAEDGALIPLTEQDRSLWNQESIARGVALVTGSLSRNVVGPYQLQAAIAAVHDEAASADDTDWPQILALYDLLRQVSDNPVVDLNHAVAIAMVHGPEAGLQRLAALDGDQRLAGSHRVAAVRAHLLEMTGEFAQARAQYQDAARLTTSRPERRYLSARADRLAPGAT